MDRIHFPDLVLHRQTHRLTCASKDIPRPAYRLARTRGTLGVRATIERVSVTAQLIEANTGCHGGYSPGGTSIMLRQHPYQTRLPRVSTPRSEPPSYARLITTHGDNGRFCTS